MTFVDLIKSPSPIIFPSHLSSFSLRFLHPKRGREKKVFVSRYWFIFIISHPLRFLKKTTHRVISSLICSVTEAGKKKIPSKAKPQAQLSSAVSGTIVTTCRRDLLLFGSLLCLCWFEKWQMKKGISSTARFSPFFKWIIESICLSSTRKHLKSSRVESRAGGGSEEWERERNEKRRRVTQNKAKRFLVEAEKNSNALLHVQTLPGDGGRSKVGSELDEANWKERNFTETLWAPPRVWREAAVECEEFPGSGSWCCGPFVLRVLVTLQCPSAAGPKPPLLPLHRLPPPHRGRPLDSIHPHPPAREHQKLISSNRNEIEADEFNCSQAAEQTNREATCRFLILPRKRSSARGKI